ncbi:MAG: hypothetical protein HZB95_04445 [Nitrosomonadales bacterium]|nr:hypothetical protein [Nitrosomonadales bacterium]
MSTESKIYWGVGIMSVLILVGSFFMPGNPSRKDDVPWHIEHPSPDSVRVFGLTLGESSANQAEERFKEEGKPSLFKSADGRLVAEVFFEQVDMAGLRSKVVVTVAVPETELKEMYERGLRMAATGSGKKITLSPDDVAKLRAMPISSLTYMPGVRVEEAMFLKRFGEPAMRIQEKKSGAMHWLYPQNGLDITLGGGEKPLLQYVSPRDFDKLLAPLKAESENKE